MSLRNTCKKIIQKEVFECVKKEEEWKVLVVDDIGLGIMNACFTVIEILIHNVLYIDTLSNKGRSSVGNYEVIYFIAPTQENIDAMEQDFLEGQNIYAAAHVFFHYALDDNLFKNFCNTEVAIYTNTLKEIFIAFVPSQSRVFTMKEEDTLQNMFEASRSFNLPYWDTLAERIITLCCTLNIYPLIRYSTKNRFNSVLAKMLQAKLDRYAKELFPSQMEGPKKSRLLILDRSCDCTSPLLHDLTLQSVVHDLLPVEGNVYRFSSPTMQCDETIVDEDHDVALDETDAFWIKHRHMHIANVADSLADMMKAFESADSGHKNENQLRRLSQDMNAIVQLQVKRKYINYRYMVTECLNLYGKTVKALAAFEQDLATGKTSGGKTFSDPHEALQKILISDTFSELDKMRVFILYVLYHGGIPERKLNELLDDANLDELKPMVDKMDHFGCTIVTNKKGKKPESIVPRMSRKKDIVFKDSRWTPVIKDIMELSLSDELDEKDFPYVFNADDDAEEEETALGGTWCKDKEIERHYLIIFILGGATFSEMRCAYEVTKLFNNWEVIVGSNFILTPEKFLNEVGQLDSFTRLNPTRPDIDE